MLHSGKITRASVAIQVYSPAFAALATTSCAAIRLERSTRIDTPPLSPDSTYYPSGSSVESVEQPCRDEASTSQTNWRWTGGGRSGARGREGGNHDRGRAIALADLEWKSEERGEKHRPYPRSDASFPGRAGQPEIDRAVAKALDGLTGAEQVFDRPERVGGQLRRTPPHRVESRDRDHRRDSQFPGQPPDEQKSANALVTARRRPTASGSVRSLQWHARFRVRTEIPSNQRLIPPNRCCRLTPSFAPVPPTKLATTY